MAAVSWTESTLISAAANHNTNASRTCRRPQRVLVWARSKTLPLTVRPVANYLCLSAAFVTDCNIVVFPLSLVVASGRIWLCQTIVVSSSFVPPVFQWSRSCSFMCIYIDASSAVTLTEYVTSASRPHVQYLLDKIFLSCADFYFIFYKNYIEI